MKILLVLFLLFLISALIIIAIDLIIDKYRSPVSSKEDLKRNIRECESIIETLSDEREIDFYLDCIAYYKQELERHEIHGK